MADKNSHIALYDAASKAKGQPSEFIAIEKLKPLGVYDSAGNLGAPGQQLIMNAAGSGVVWADVQGITDTTAPTAPAFTTVANGTDATAIDVEGTGEVGASYTIIWPDGLTTIGTVGATGDFGTETSAVNQPSGNVTITLTDPSGNTSAPSVVPWVAAGVPAAPVVSSVANGADPTAIDASGTAEANSTIDITWPDATTSTATTDAAGNWGIVTSPTAQPTGNIVVTAKDAANNVSTATTIAWTAAVAPAAPNALTVTNSGDATNIACVSGTGDEVGATIEVTFPSGEINNSSVVPASGNWGPICSTVAQPNGNVSVKLTNGAGASPSTTGVHTAFVAPPLVYPNKQLFSYTGADQAFTIPASANWLKIKAWGAGSLRSAGGYATLVIDVNKFTESVLAIMVGQTSIVPQDGTLSNNTYGFGGVGYSALLTGADSGAGLSGVFTGNGAITDIDAPRALIIAGGAGGLGANTGGINAYGAGGTGGGPTAGGQATMAGKDAPFYGGTTNQESHGGGGGGYYGGADFEFSAISICTSGNGGTSFVSADSETSSILSTPEDRTDTPTNGGLDVALDDIAPNNGDPDKGTSGDKANNGLIVIEWD